VVDAGKAAGAGDQVGTVLYNRGMYAAMLAAEAIKTAQEMHGVSAINAAQLRDGMENLEMTEAKMAALGLPGFGPEFKVSCENHGGNGYGAVSQWDAAAGEFTLITDYFQSDQEIINKLVAEDSAAFAAENGITPRC
jgi:branched-chain amino acid transport system substrate-binding protein